ncbi:GNAT family N-acetyltransferase [Candidatus Acetothermia bacterium]|nr:GNAT family N-acetyltransferase [Candidatus Acetothermia bacterium]
MLNTLQIKAFDYHKATEREFSLLNEFNNRIRQEYWPEDQPLTLEETIQNLRATPAFSDLRLWTAWTPDRSKIVGRASATIMRTEDNQHLMYFDIVVLSELRRQGLAKRLLTHIATVARTENRRVLQTDTDSKIPSGETFMKRLGARMGLRSRTNQLRIAELDKNLIRRWTENAPTDEFELGLWNGAYPEAEIGAIAKMIDVMNAQPKDNLEQEDWHWTPEEIRQWQKSLAERKTEQWTIYARDRKTRELAGYTEVFWNPHHSENLNQGDTGVLPKFRNKGLGRWLKATMLEKVLHERPYVKRIRTGNANSNAPMLAINNELGFKPYKDWSTWQVELNQMLEYLEEKTLVSQNRT